MTIDFKNLGPMIKEERLAATCEKCGNYIYKCYFQDSNSKGNVKVVFVCKNCHNNSKK